VELEKSIHSEIVSAGPSKLRILHFRGPANSNPARTSPSGRIRVEFDSIARSAFIAEIPNPAPDPRFSTGFGNLHDLSFSERRI
jgi:hypothetical protein